VTPAGQRPAFELVQKWSIPVDVVKPAVSPLVYSAMYLGRRWGEVVGRRKENQDLFRRQVRMVGTLEEISTGETLLGLPGIEPGTVALSM